MDYFWDYLVPQANLLWRRRLMQENANLHDSSVDREFPYTEKQVMWAFTSFSDAYGAVLRRQNIMFRRCACVVTDKETGVVRRNPCIPPKVGYMCLRQCTLLKSNIVRDRDKAERRWKTYKIDGLAEAVKSAEEEALKFLRSDKSSSCKSVKIQSC